MVFAESEGAAQAAAEPLRAALWGEHKLAVLLPHGHEPIQVGSLHAHLPVLQCVDCQHAISTYQGTAFMHLRWNKRLRQPNFIAWAICDLQAARVLQHRGGRGDTSLACVKAGLGSAWTISCRHPSQSCLYLVQAMHAFRDNKATFLLATPAAARGLDLPAVSHVYNMGPPADAVEYLHRAGRVGRIGASVPGVPSARSTLSAGQYFHPPAFVSAGAGNICKTLCAKLCQHALEQGADGPWKTAQDDMLMPCLPAFLNFCQFLQCTHTCEVSAGQYAGVVTTLVTPAEQAQLNAISQELQLAIEDSPEPPAPVAADDNSEQVRRNLEDLYRLY